MLLLVQPCKIPLTDIWELFPKLGEQVNQAKLGLIHAHEISHFSAFSRLLQYYRAGITRLYSWEKVILEQFSIDTGEYEILRHGIKCGIVFH